jgi:hypothetical protein
MRGRPLCASVDVLLSRFAWGGTVGRDAGDFIVTGLLKVTVDALGVALGLAVVAAALMVTAEGVAFGWVIAGLGPVTHFG